MVWVKAKQLYSSCTDMIYFGTLGPRTNQFTYLCRKQNSTLSPVPRQVVPCKVSTKLLGLGPRNTHVVRRDIKMA